MVCSVYCCIVAILYKTSWHSMVWTLLLLYSGHPIQNIMVVYGMEVIIAVPRPSCREHYASVWQCMVILLYHGHLLQNIMVVYGIECVLCCNMALLYRALWQCMVQSVFFAVMWLSYTEHYGSVWYGVCYLLLCGHLVQNIMVVQGIESVLCCIMALLYRTLWQCLL